MGHHTLGGNGAQLKFHRQYYVSIVAAGDAPYRTHPTLAFVLNKIRLLCAIVRQHIKEDEIYVTHAPDVARNQRKPSSNLPARIMSLIP